MDRTDPYGLFNELAELTTQGIEDDYHDIRDDYDRLVCKVNDITGVLESRNGGDATMITMAPGQFYYRRLPVKTAGHKQYLETETVVRYDGKTFRNSTRKIIE